MKLENKSTRDYMYSNGIKVAIFHKGDVLECDDKIAKILLKQDGVIEVVDKDEVEKLKAEIANLKAKKEETLTRKEMLAIAEKKGLKFPKNISNARLAELIK